VLGLTRVLSAEGVKYGVTDNCILPGRIDTEMVRGEAQKVSDARGTPPDEVIKKVPPQPASGPHGHHG
jgi:3-hydroxybutyrate dehydrogenase